MPEDLTLDELQSLFDSVQGDDDEPPPVVHERPDAPPAMFNEQQRFPEWPHHEMKQKVLRLLRGRCVYHDLVTQFQIRKSGIQADKMIEQFIYDVLDTFREEWAVGPYAGCRVNYNPTSFPDITITSGREVILGIEIKSWHTLAKEGQPCFRFQASPLACAPHDILVVFPYYWENLWTNHGVALLLAPYIENSRFVATQRNETFDFEHPRNPVRRVTGITPHTSKHREEINDQPPEDKGGNFGRIGRLDLFRKFTWDLAATRVRMIDPQGVPLADKTIDEWFFQLWDKHLGDESLNRQPSTEPVLEDHLRAYKSRLRAMMVRTVNHAIEETFGEGAPPKSANGTNGAAHPTV